MSRQYLKIVCIGFLLVFFQSPIFSNAQEPSSQRLQLSHYIDGPLRTVATDGESIFLVQGNHLLRLIHAADGSYQTLNQASWDDSSIRQMVVAYDHLYLLTARYLVIFDVQTLNEQQRIGGGGESLYIKDDHLLVISRQAGVKHYRIEADGLLQTLPTQPTTEEALSAVMLAQGQIVVAEQGAGLQIFDHEYRMLASVFTDAMLLQTDNTMIYALNNQRLSVIDMQPNGDLSTVGLYASLHDAQAIEQVGAYWIVADLLDGLKVYDSNFHLIQTQVNTPSHAVAYSRNRQWVVSAESDHIVLYDARQLPQLVETSRIPVWSEPTQIIFAENGYAWVALGDGGIGVLNLNTSNVVAALPFSGPVMDMVFHPNDPRVIFVLLGDGRLMTLSTNLQTPQNLAVIADFEISGQPSALAIDGVSLMVAAGRAGLFAFDVRNPTQPRREIFASASERITQVQKLGETWAVLDGDSLRFFEIRDNSFVEVRAASEMPHARWLDHIGENLWIGGQYFVEAYTLAEDELAMQYQYRANQAFSSMVMLDSHIALGGYDGTLIILDVQNPDSMRELHTIPIADSIRTLTYHDDMLLVLDGTSRLIELSISDLLNPSLNTQTLTYSVYETTIPRTNFDPVSTPLVPDTPVTMSAILEQENIRWFGTANGELWKQTDREQPRLVFRNNAQSIRDIAIFDENTLLLITGATGVLWFDILSEQVTGQLENFALGSAVSPNNDMLAVATGVCGLWIYETNTQHLLAIAQDGVINDVYWDDASTLHTLLDGHEAVYQYTAQAPMVLPPVTINIDVIEGVMQWQTSSNGCLPMMYEIYRDGKLLTSTQTTQWLLSESDHISQWQVVAVDSFGNRSASHIVAYGEDQAGWIVFSQQYEPLTAPQETRNRTSLFILITLGIIVLGSIGIGFVWRFLH